jgi:hypothetical protein
MPSTGTPVVPQNRVWVADHDAEIFAPVDHVGEELVADVELMITTIESISLVLRDQALLSTLSTVATKARMALDTASGASIAA